LADSLGGEAASTACKGGEEKLRCRHRLESIAASDDYDSSMTTATEAMRT